MKIKLPKIEYQIGDSVKLDLEQKSYNGITLRSRLIRIIVQDMYRRYSVSKLTPIFKSLVKKNIEMLDKANDTIIVGMSAHGGMCMEFVPCNKCYVDGGYSGLTYFKYDVVVFARINTSSEEGRNDLNDVQYKIKGQFFSDNFKK